MMREVSPIIARMRMEALSREESYEGLDKELIGLYNSLIDFYSNYIMGSLLSYGEDVIVRVVKPFDLDGFTLLPGEYVRLKPERAAALILAGLVVPGKATSIKIGRRCKKGEG
jgi:hypothetical protein